MTLRERITNQMTLQSDIMRARVQALYRQGSQNAQVDGMLSSAFEELALALEQLQRAEQALHQQQSHWLNRQSELELECQRYKDLFEHAPSAYLVTSIAGSIRQANSAALELLRISDRMAVGRMMGLFIPEGQRRTFRSALNQLLECDRPQEWITSMRSWEGAQFEVRLTASVLRGASGRPLALHWLIHDLSQQASQG
ncbi:MAG TPA: PAS domain-containing protein [Roseiflexaceae bacterium]|nr:PAS domain-containing protein [Roseiflexaceae bacterium]